MAEKSWPWWRPSSSKWNRTEDPLRSPTGTMWGLIRRGEVTRPRGGGLFGLCRRGPRVEWEE
eukprot:1188989-Prorocentrum_minimum.AAC.1